MSEWKEYKLGDIIETNARNVDKGFKYQIINYLDTGSITCNNISDIQIINIKDAPSRAKRLAQNDDIIYSLVRPNQQHYGYITNAPANLVVSTGFVTITCNVNIIYPKYLYYFLIQPQIIDYLQAIAETSVSTYPSIKPSDIEDINISLPPMEEQKRIAGILSALDDKIELNRRINANLELQAQTLFNHWFVENPQNTEWQRGCLNDIISIYDYMRKPLSGQEREKMQKIYPYYGAASLMDYVDNYLFDGIYLLLGEDGTVVDEKGFPILQYIEGKFWVNNHAHILQGDNGFTTESLYILLKQTNVRSIVTGAVQPKISQANLKNINILIPPRELLDKYNELIAPMFEQIRRNSKENTSLAQLRDTLLPKLMNDC